MRNSYPSAVLSHTLNLIDTNIDMDMDTDMDIDTDTDIDTDRDVNNKSTRIELSIYTVLDYSTHQAH